MKELILATMGEMTLKGQNRKSFEAVLLKNLRQRLANLGQWDIRAAQSAIYIEPRDSRADAHVDDAYARCGRVFGVAALVRTRLCEKDMEAIKATARDYLADKLHAVKTFKMAARRADKTFPLDSMELNREMGGFLLDTFPHLQVDVHSPELVVTVEIRERGAYLHAGKDRGAGGLPIPCSGRAALLLSGGIDSPVAGWQMAKRGLALVPIHFASPPYTSPRAAAKVLALADILASWCGPLPYHYVRYTAAQEYLRDHLQKREYFTVLMRRSMLRIARLLAEKDLCDAIITGESLAQVASQTLPALACTDEVQDLPILRPCIGMDKGEITELARKIGTFETSIQPYEDCCTIFSPPHPKTRPRLADIKHLEETLPGLAALETEAAKTAEFSLRMPEK